MDTSAPDPADIPADPASDRPAPEDPGGVEPLTAEQGDLSTGSNRYTVPLSTLLGGAFVSTAEHVVEQPVPDLPASSGSAFPVALGDAGD